MKLFIMLGYAGAILYSASCTSHLVFMEESHTGLKISAGGSAPSPYEISLGYRRGMVAAVPKQNRSGENQSGASPSGMPVENVDPGGNGDTVVVLPYDRYELMSLYTEFCANVGFNDPIEFHNLLVTGDAAAWLLADPDNGLRDALGGVIACNSGSNN